MSRLIDADALIEAIWKNHKETEEMYDLYVDELKEVYCGVVATIDEQPTAYDVEKVVEEMKKAGFSDESAPNRVVNIVRKGGVDDKVS